MDNVLGQTQTKQAGFPMGFVAPLALTVALIYALYWEMFRDWWNSWNEPGSFYAHAMFVPFFVVLMIYRNRERLAATPWQPTWAGSVLLVPAIILLLLGKHAGVTVVQSFSFILLLVSVVWMLFGTARMKYLWFPLFFIATVVPVPDQLINRVAFPIQLESMKIATFLLNLMTFSAQAQGTTINMDSYHMAVEGQCSGFRTLVSLLTFAAAFGYILEGALWKRWLIFLITAPLSLLINSVRITLIGIVGELISKQAASTFHDSSGFICLIMAFLFLFGFARVIRCGSFLGIPLNDDEEPPQKDAEAEETPPAPPPVPWQEQVREWLPTNRQIRRVLPYFALLDVALLFLVGVQGRVKANVIPEPPIATTQVPMTLASGETQWNAEASFDVGVIDKLTKSIQDQLHPTRLINRDYVGNDGSRLNFFMTAGNARWTFHDPHNCSLGSDAELKDVGVIDVPTPRGTLRVLESRFERNGSNAPFEMMYCYVVQGDVMQRTEDVHRNLVKQSFFGDSGKPSYFLRFTQTVPGTSEAQRKPLLALIGAMWNEIEPVLTSKVKAIPEPPPVPLDDPH